MTKKNICWREEIGKKKNQEKNIVVFTNANVSKKIKHYSLKSYKQK